MKPTTEIVQKILSVLSRGLTQGIGEREPGKMCVEAAVCYAYGLPHGDNPPCVGEEVRKFKINLNDSKFWPDNMARAVGLKRLAIAQLGSNEIDQEKFKEEVFKQSQLLVIPWTFDQIPINVRVPEHEELKEFARNCFDKERLREKFKPYMYNYNYIYIYIYIYMYNYNYNYHYYSYTPEQKHEILKLSAEAAVQALIILKSPGCEFLNLIPS